MRASGRRCASACTSTGLLSAAKLSSTTAGECFAATDSISGNGTSRAASSRSGSSLDHDLESPGDEVLELARDYRCHAGDSG